MHSRYYALVPKDRVKNLEFRAKVLRRMAEDKDFADAMYQACSEDILFWINTFVWTYDPRRTWLGVSRIPMITYDFQDGGILDLQQSIEKGRDLCIEKSRDMGASWICMLVFLWYFMFRPLRSFLLVSRTEAYVDEAGNPKSLFWKMDYALKNLPPTMMPPGFRWTEHRKKLHIRNPSNGCVIDGESTTGRTSRGDRRTAVMFDEFAAVEQGFAVLSASRDVTDCRIFNSTHEGTGTAYYAVTETNIKKLRFHWTQHYNKKVGLWTTKNDGKDIVIVDRKYWRETNEWERDPIHEEVIKAGHYTVEKVIQYWEDVIEQKGVPKPDGKMRSPWYGHQCDRAAHAAEIAQEIDIDVLGSGFQFFQATIVEKYIEKFCTPPYVVGDLEYDTDHCQPAKHWPFRPDSKGSLRLWLPLTENGDVPRGRKYVFGIDISAGTGASNSTVTVMDPSTGEKVAAYANSRIRPEPFARFVVALARWFGGAYIMHENFGPGRQFGDALLDTGYRFLYYKRTDESALASKTSLIPGFAPTKENKLALLGDYRRGIEEEKFVNRDKAALREALEYVFLPNGSVEHSKAVDSHDPSGAAAQHGDRAIADALAWKACREQPNRAKSEQNKPPPGSFAARRLRAKQSNTRKTYWG